MPAPLNLIEKYSLWVLTKGISVPFLILCTVAFNLLAISANSEAINNTVVAGKAAYLAGSYETARTRWEEAKKRGSGDAAYYLGVLYIEGRSVRYDEEKAIELFHLAATHENFLAAVELGAMLENNPNVKNLGSSEKWYGVVSQSLPKLQKLAEGGDPFAQSALGFLYGFGKVVKQNHGKYIYWQKKAADQGFASAQYHLSYALETATGPERNLPQAFKLMQNAANQGLVYAQERLGVLYRDGIGTKPNNEAAIKWFSKASAAGYFEAERQLAELYNDLGRLEDAAPLAQKSYDVIHKIYGSSSYYSAKAKVTFAYSLAFHQRQTDIAKPLLLDAIAYFKSLYGEEHWELLRALKILSNIYIADRNFTAAKSTLDHAEKITIKWFGKDHASYAHILLYLGDNFEGQSKFKEAAATYERAHETYSKSFGPDSLQAASLKLKLARTIAYTGAYDRAETLYAQSVRIFKKLHREGDWGLARTYMKVAGFYRDRFNFEKALKQFSNAEKLIEGQSGTPHKIRAQLYFERAQVWMAVGNRDSSENDFKRAISITDEHFPENANDRAQYRNSLSNLYIEKGDIPKAEKVINEAIIISEGGNKAAKINTLTSYVTLANIQIANRDMAAVRSYFDLIEKFVATEKIEAPEAIGPLYIANAVLSMVNGELEKANELMQRGVQLLEGHYGPDNHLLVQPFYRYASLLQQQGKKELSQSIAERAFRIIENNITPNNAQFIFQNVRLLSDFRFDQERLVRFFEKAEPIVSTVMGENSTKYAEFLINYAETLGFEHEDTRKKVKLYRQALSIYEAKFGVHDSKLIDVLEKLADKIEYTYADSTKLEGIQKLSLDQRAKIYSKFSAHLREGELEREKFLKRISEISQSSFGRLSIQYAEAITALGTFYSSQSDLGDKDAQRANKLKALAYFEESLKILREAYDVNNNDISSISFVLWNLSFTHETLGNYDKALSYSRQNYSSLKRGLAPIKNIDQVDKGYSRERVPDERASARMESRRKKGENDFVRHLKLLLNENISGDRSRREKEAFEALQLSRSTQAARAINKLTARFAAEKSGAGEAVRELQDTIMRRAVVIEQLTDEFAKQLSSAPENAVTASIKDYRVELEHVNERISFLHDKIAREFPRYNDLISNQPASLEQIQKSIGRNEALVTTFENYSGFWIFLVRQNLLSVHFEKRTNYREANVAENVKKIRESVDLSKVMELSDLLKFDILAAQKLYSQIFGKIEASLKGVDHLIYVPSKSLQQIPISLLVYDQDHPRPTQLADFQNIPWLYKKFAISTLPSIASLKSLRTIGRKSAAALPFIGFGAPIFKSNEAHVAGTNKTAKPEIIKRQAALNALSSLPNTAEELDSIAKFLGARKDAVILAEKASETEVKKLDLKNWRVLAFATHGLTAAEKFGLDEPAIALTPGPKDDGFLTASEISQLKLDADWVILSACNTAAGQDEKNEGLSGLARAFLYAGSRALLVSHWPVETKSAKRLTVGIFKQLRLRPNISRAEALRRSIAQLAENDNEAHYSHPAFWAPFVLVGDGR